MNRRSTPPGGRRSLLPWLGVAAIVVVAGGSFVVTSLALNLQVAATNYVTGEGLWSKARAEAVQALYAFTATGNREELNRARAALAVPLGDRRARLALDADPPDREAAREGFLAGNNAPQDISRMIWFYLTFSDVGVFSEAVAIWREADPYILELERLADELERVHEGPAEPNPQRLAALRSELGTIADRVRPLELAFSDRLAEGVRWLRSVLTIVTVGTFLLLALAAAAIVAWSVRRVRASDQVVRKTFEQAGVGMARVNEDGCLLSVNDALCSLAARPRSDLVGRTLRELLHPEDRPPGERLEDVLTSAHGGHHEFRLLRGDDHPIWVRSTLSTVELGVRQAKQIFATFEDISEARRLTEQLSYQARHDMLTGLSNRYEFERLVERARRGARRDGVPHALCFLDLDQFKVVNDASGHAAGDALLNRIAEVLATTLRATDSVGRIGGDEFAILLDRTPLATAQEVAEMLRSRIATTEVAFEGRRFRTGCSIGLTEVRGDDADAGAILRRADVACYMAKERGRNRVHTYAESDETQAARQGEMAWVERIRSALAEDRFGLEAQRIVATDGEEAPRYELLLRLHDEAGDVHGPGAFLPAAERYGLIGEIDRWVVRAALATLARHPGHVARLGACHVNVSARSVSDPAFLADLLSALDASGVPPDRLCIEITETAAMTSLADARRFLSALRERGVRVALDDFGSGLSSFAYLKTLDVDLVKIDGLLVKDVARNPLDRTMVRSIHDLARVLGKRTVTEFVEDDEAWAVVREIGVDFVQGFGVHRPQAWEEMLEEG